MEDWNENEMLKQALKEAGFNTGEDEEEPPPPFDDELPPPFDETE
jgi:hypothetical protein